MNGSGKRVDVCHDSPWRIPPPRVVVVAATLVVVVAAAAAAMTAIGGGSLLGEGREGREVAVTKGALHTSANSNQ